MIKEHYPHGFIDTLSEYVWRSVIVQMLVETVLTKRTEGLVFVLCFRLNKVSATMPCQWRLGQVQWYNIQTGYPSHAVFIHRYRLLFLGISVFIKDGRGGDVTA